MRHKKYIVINTKGGSGKTVLGLHVLPAIFNGSAITYYSIDSTNRLPKDLKELGFKTVISSTEEMYASLELKSEKDNSFERDSFMRDFIFSEDPDRVSIMDVGGGTDVKRMFEALSLDDILKHIEHDDFAFIIPIFDGIRDIENGYDTYHEIIRHTVEYAKRPRIIFALNRVDDPLDDKANRASFISFFGDKDATVDGIEKMLKQDGIKDIEYGYIPKTTLFGIAESTYQSSTLAAYDTALKTKLDPTKQELEQEYLAGIETEATRSRRLLRKFKYLVEEHLTPFKEILLDEKDRR